MLFFEIMLGWWNQVYTKVLKTFDHKGLGGSSPPPSTNGIG